MQGFKNIINILFIFCWACSTKVANNKKIFTYNEATGIASLDPAYAKNQSVMWPTNLIYNTLVETDSNLQIQPSIAKNWQISTDKKTYTFYLHNHIFFHDNIAFANGKGRKLTAYDVVYSLERIINPKVASPGAWIFNGKVDTLQPFVAINDTTFQLKLLQPFQPILGILSMKYCSIVPKEVVAYYGDEFRRNPCGTGPFTFAAWYEGEALILHKNQHYWEKDTDGTALPKLDAVKITFLDNKASEFLAFRQGKLSFINDIDPSFKDEVLTKTGELRNHWKNKFKLYKHNYLNVEYLGILQDAKSTLVAGSPLKEKAVRIAMNKAINKEQLMLHLRNSIGIPANAGFIPLALQSNFINATEYNIAEAKKLLSVANYKGELISLVSIPIYADIANYVAKQWQIIGLNVKVEIVPKSVLLQQTAQGKVLLFRGSWIADYPDAENFMTVFYGKNPAPPNYTRYNNEKFNRLYQQALYTIDDSLRLKLYEEMNNIIMQDVPVIPLWYDRVIHLVNNNVSHWQPNALNLLNLKKVTIQ
jgi:peptide/nickel transport system substrate-binding protein